jgi:hypothetical protein|tara:strand:- start:1138 stop:1302 length:165 start_codon:yes stop_codon:yes gene_type:complete
MSEVLSDIKRVKEIKKDLKFINEQLFKCFGLKFLIDYYLLKTNNIISLMNIQLR